MAALSVLIRGGFAHQLGADRQQPLFLDERPQRDHARRERLAMNRMGITIGGQLERVEPEDLRAPRVVARAAFDD